MPTTITLDTQANDVVVLGPDGRRINVRSPVQAADIPPARRGDLVREIGSGGPAFLAGLIVDDEEHNKKLQGVDGVRIFDKMRRTDAQVAGVLAGLQLPIMSSEAVIERPEDNQREAERVTDEHLDFARYNLFERIDFSEALQHSLSSFWAGYSWFEKVYAVEDRALVIDRLAPRLAVTLWRWQADEHGALTGVTQRARVGSGRNLVEVQIPRNKIAIFTVGKEAGDPGGKSLLRAAYRAYSIKDVLYKLEAIRFERYAIGVPVVTLPDQYTDDQMDMAKQIAANWRGAEQSFVVLVGDMKVELVQTGSGALDIQPAIRHHNEEIAKSALMQFINLGTTDTGSRALGESMMEFFYDAVEGHAKTLASQWNREVLWPLMDLNFSDRPRPTLRFEDLGAVSLSQLSAGLSMLKEHISPSPETENFLRRRYGMPVRIEKEEVPEDEPEDQSTPEGMAEAKLHAHKEINLSSGAFWRERTDAEKFVRLRQIDARLEDGKDAIVAELLKLREDIANDLSSQIQRQWSAGPRGLAAVQIGVQLLARAAMAVTPEMESIYQFGRTQVHDELERQAASKGRQLSHKPGNVRQRTILTGQVRRLASEALDRHLLEDLQLRDEGLTPGEVKELARFRAGELVTRLMRKTQDAALAIAAGRWRTQGNAPPSGEALEEIMEAVFDSVERESQLVANQTASEMLNLGRDFESQRLKDQIELAQYSAILDSNGCENCSSADGEETELGSEEYYDLTPPLNSSRLGACEGGGACRCLWVYILRDATPE